MILTNFDGAVRVRSQKELVRQIESLRQGIYGAFILAHRANGPSLWIHVNKAYACLHYFPVPDFLIHAGYQAIEMTPPKCKRNVRFRVLRDRIEEFGGAYISIPPDNLVALPDAIIAAREFFKKPRLPTSIRWEEL